MSAKAARAEDRRVLRCLVADDHPAVLAAMSAFVEEHGFELLGPAADGKRAIELAAEERPDLAFIDYRMPRASGAALLQALKEASPETQLIVFTGQADEQLARAALAAGADAVVLKEAPLVDLARAVDLVLVGRVYVDPVLAPSLIDDRPRSSSLLTKREKEVLTLLAQGLSHEEIGRRLSISDETVRTHVRKASVRLNAATRTEAVATALRLGLIA
jgi:two-component system, NarL family, response regulator LiaR